MGVDGGADALIEAGYKPDMIIGDMDSCSDATLQSGAELVVHAYHDGRAPGLERIEQLGLEAVVFPALGTSEDAAMLLADSKGAQLLVAVGTHASLVEFLDKGRAGMASTFLTRLRVGPKLVDAKGVSRIYRSQIKTWHLVLLVLSGLLALVTALLFTDVGSAVGSLIGARIRDAALLDQGTLHLINFRYHIVSLMAVFIALSVGIAVGVSLSPSVDQGMLAQAAQDRKQVTDLRAELDRRNALDEYREAYEHRVGKVVTDERAQRHPGRHGRDARRADRAWCRRSRPRSRRPAGPSYTTPRSTRTPSTRQTRRRSTRPWRRGSAARTDRRRCRRPPRSGSRWPGRSPPAE